METGTGWERDGSVHNWSVQAGKQEKFNAYGDIYLK
jgi:hypothetical protein